MYSRVADKDAQYSLGINEDYQEGLLEDDDFGQGK